MERTLHIPYMTTDAQNEAIRLTVGKETQRLRQFIRSRVDNVPDAEDILQDTFMQFVSAMRLEPIRLTASWLFKVAGNRIIDWYRKRKPVSIDTHQFEFEDEEGPVFLGDLLTDSGNNPEDQFMNMTIWSELNDALDELPPNQREVFTMHELEGKSFREISLITGETVPTLLSRKRYAVLYLRERLRDLYEELLES
jgi:RNA polymerase sigma factor (sigma-70 family)